MKVLLSPMPSKRSTERLSIEKWSEIQKEYASELSNATVVELYCGHYVHNYKQEQISEEMKEFIENIK